MPSAELVRVRLLRPAAAVHREGEAALHDHVQETARAQDRVFRVALRNYVYEPSRSGLAARSRSACVCVCAVCVYADAVNNTEHFTTV